MKNHYIQAVLELLKTNADSGTVLKGLHKTLVSRGHEQLHATILANVLKTLEASGSAGAALVIVPNEAALATYKAEIAEVLQDLKSDLPASAGQAGGATIEKIDDTLIGGYIVEANNTRVDSCYKTKLTNICRSITT